MDPYMHTWLPRKIHRLEASCVSGNVTRDYNCPEPLQTSQEWPLIFHPLAATRRSIR